MSELCQRHDGIQRVGARTRTRPEGAALQGAGRDARSLIDAAVARLSCVVLNVGSSVGTAFHKQAVWDHDYDILCVSQR